MIAVVGGTGTVGSPAVNALAQAGQQVRILSRNEPASLPDGASHFRFDMTADDPSLALEGVDVLLDLANSSSKPGKVLLDGTSRLLAACRKSGVGHYVGISILGCEKVGLGYYKAKTRQEGLIRESPVPWSLLRATQFHELVNGLMSATARFGILPAGKVRLQPVAAAAVGARLSEMALAGPLNGTEQLTGPKVETLDELAAAWRLATGRRCLTLPLPTPGRTGRALRDGALTDPEVSGPGPDFLSWLESRQV